MNEKNRQHGWVIILLIGLCGITTISWAAAEDTPVVSYSGYISLTSDYRFRSLSNSDNKPSLQGEVRLDHYSGLYAALFASSIDLDIGTSLESDYIVGYRYALNSKSALYFNYTYFDYPNADRLSNADYAEWGIDYVRDETFRPEDSLTVGVRYSPNYSGKTGKAYYYAASYDVPISEKLSLNTGIGYSAMRSRTEFTNAFGGNGRQKGYVDYKLGISTQIAGLDAELAWVDNNLKTDSDTADGTAVLTISKSF
jgi:uncharacterized protein (TIGR02001 family)